MSFDCSRQEIIREGKEKKRIDEIATYVIIKIYSGNMAVVIKDYK